MIEHGAKFDYNRHLKYIFQAAKKGFKDIIRFYIEEGYDIEKKDEDGETLIFKAVRGKSFGICKFLYDGGAKINIFNSYGRSLQEIIEESKHQLIIDYFKNLFDPNLLYDTPNKSIKQIKRICLIKNITQDNTEINSKKSNRSMKRNKLKISVEGDKSVYYSFC